MLSQIPDPNVFYYRPTVGRAEMFKRASELSGLSSPYQGRLSGYRICREDPEKELPAVPTVAGPGSRYQCVLLWLPTVEAAEMLEQVIKDEYSIFPVSGTIMICWEDPVKELPAVLTVLTQITDTNAFYYRLRPLGRRECSKEHAR